MVVSAEDRLEAHLRILDSENPAQNLDVQVFGETLQVYVFGEGRNVVSMASQGVADALINQILPVRIPCSMSEAQGASS